MSLDMSPADENERGPDVSPEVVGKRCDPEGAACAANEVWSGHSIWRKIRFASSLVGPMGSSTALSFSRDIYVLQLGADPTALGLALLVVSFWLPACSPLAGYVMDKELLRRWFSPERWGRRAQWFLLHIIVLTIATGLLYLPPSQDPKVLVAWISVISIIGGWAETVIFVAFESARVEIYPLKEERVLVESFTKVTCGLGSGSSALAMTFILSNASLPVRLGTSVGLALITAFSAQAVPIFVDARKPADFHLVRSFWSEVKSMMGKPALQHYIWGRFWQGGAEATMLTFSLYYLTYIGKVIGGERQQWVFILAAVLVVVEATTLPVFTLAFRSGFLDMQRTCAIFAALASFLPPLLLRVLPIPPRYGLLMYTSLVRVSFSPQTFFKTAAFCWVVDEDCLDGGGKRREASLSGFSNLIGNLGKAAASGFLFLGFGQAGLVANNCTLDCEGSQDRDACIALCEHNNVAVQPQAVLSYLEAMFLYIVPICMFISSVHTWLFPIRGERLERLTRRQVEACTAPPAAVPAGHPDEHQMEACTAPPAAVPAGHPDEHQMEEEQGR